MGGLVAIILSDWDEQYALRLATGRNQKEATHGAMTYSGRSSLQVHLDGTRSELALARYYGVDPDAAIYADGGDQGADLNIHGWLVQVKATRFVRAPWLRVEAHRRLDCHLYFLCVVGDTGPVLFCGYATRPEVLAADRRRLRQGGPVNYVLEESDLRRPRARAMV